MNLIFDIETNGLLPKVSTIHCLVIYDLDEKKLCTYNDQGSQDPIVRGIQRINDADCVIGHNVIGYDLPVLAQLYPWFQQPDCVIDTLILSHLFFTDMMGRDCKHRYKHMPSKLYGRHSLEAHGYRLGEYKGCFAKTTDWQDWSQDMEDYCIQDVNVTTKLWESFQPYLNG